jgi:hypothetical protein
MPKVTNQHNDIIQKTIEILNKLPHEKVNEVADFADFILSKFESQILQRGIEEISETSVAFAFLNDEDDLYTLKDAKEVYHGKG